MSSSLAKFVPLMKPSKGFRELKSTVIDTDLCSRCGSCAAFCDRIAIGDNPELTERGCTLDSGAIKCSNEGTCFDSCPHTSFSMLDQDRRIFGEERPGILGRYIKVLALRSKLKEVLERAQDGGATTALALFALENGYADGAIVVDRSGDWNTHARVVTKREDLIPTAGSKFTRTTSGTKAGEALRGRAEASGRRFRRLIFIGTGCQVSGARRLEASLLKGVPGVKIMYIGLYCTESFIYDRLKETAKAVFNRDIGEAVRMDISSGKFTFVTSKGEELSQPVKLFHDCVTDACDICTDFTATLADISMGSVDSAPGWTTAMIRSEKALEMVQRAAELGYLEISDVVGTADAEKLTGLKIRRSARVEARRRAKGLYVPEYGVVMK